MIHSRSPLSVHVLVASGLAGAFLVVSSLTACAESGSDIPPGEGADTQQDEKASLPAPTHGSSDTPQQSPESTTSSSSSSSSSSTSSSGSTTSSSGGGSGVPACSWASDLMKVATKFQEINEQKPCDSTCDPTTHCCFDMLGGMGGGGGGLPGMDAGVPGAGGGTGGSCVSN